MDVRDNFGNTALIIACQNGHKRALKAVLRRGADPNAANARGNTALHYCHAFGYGETLGRYLMEKGADSSIRNRSGLVSASCLKGSRRSFCLNGPVKTTHLVVCAGMTLGAFYATRNMDTARNAQVCYDGIGH